MSGVHTFSKNLGHPSKYKAPALRYGASPTLRTHIVRRHCTKFCSTGLCTPALLLGEGRYRK
jgi:hypothetical protein